MIKKLLFVSALGFMMNVDAQSVVFKETFDTEETRNLWSIDDLDGDNDTWDFVSAEEAETPSFSGDFAWSFSWFFGAFTPDNILTSPDISLPNSDNLELSFKVAAADDEEGYFEEHYAVYVIPANSEFAENMIPVFEETLDGGYFDEGKTVKVNISEFAGQNVKLVFRHYDCTDILYLGLDDVMIENKTLAVSDINKNQIKVYPNPTSDFVKINGVNNIENVRIFDMQGKIVKEVVSDNIDVRHLPKGQYIINVYSGKEVISNKLIKN